ncbi:MAG: hypothetical protein R6X18_00715 [Chloroflexota bacterium]|jgi:hypothetical protein
MAETKITFTNLSKIKIQVQIFTGRTLVSTGVAGPGETSTLLGGSERFDIFLKSSLTGWLVARKFDNEAKAFTLSMQNGRYILT